MYWIVIVLAASALLAWLLVALRRYEHESAAAALEEVERLRETVDALTGRIEHLEAIAAADERLPVPEEINMTTKDSDSLSSGVTPRSRT
jgi:hypothetical protein